MGSPEVNNYLLCFFQVEEEVVVLAPQGQLVHFLPVVSLIADETHHSSVVCKLHDVVGAEDGFAVVGQQSEEKGAEHTSLGGPRAQYQGG